MDKIKVLYIDDERTNLNAFKATFRREFDIHLANSAEEGLDILDKYPIEVILSDQRMPEKTGVDFFESILDKHPNPMRILLTAYTDIDAVINAINKGQVYRYVTKPWKESELRLTIEDAHRVFSLKEESSKITTKYAKVFNESSDPIILFDETGTMVDYNNATLQTLEMSEDEIETLTMTTLMPDLKSDNGLVSDFGSMDSIVGEEIEFITSSGNLKVFLLSITRIRDFQDEVLNYQVILKDITKRQAHQKVLLKTIIETQEDERERISRDLHDGLGQTLAAIKLNLHAFKNRTDINLDEYDRIDLLLNESIKQMREICFEVSPSVLSEYGLLQGVEELVSRTQTKELAIDFKSSRHFPEINKPLEVAIYRVIQEFINNSIKHSEAKRIEISITDDSSHVVLNLSDDGKGFELQDVLNYSGQGLKNIKSRVNALNGRIDLKSDKNFGIKLNISFPINVY